MIVNVAVDNVRAGEACKHVELHAIVSIICLLFITRAQTGIWSLHCTAFLQLHCGPCCAPEALTLARSRGGLNH
eukprot:11212304-Lingulodinium_polyedra.AAC.1